MYIEDFNLALAPFQNTPDPRFYYAGEQHREALAAMEYTLRLRKGIALLTGEVGSGKTTLGQIVCQRCGADSRVIRVSHGLQSRTQLLHQVLAQLGDIPRRREGHTGLLDRFRDRITDQLGHNRPVVLFVDEAQTLGDEALDELRLMTNFDQPSHPAVMMLLIGQPELRIRLRHDRHAPLRQRIAMAKHLGPLDARQTTEYIDHRLRVASADPEGATVSFAPQAAADVYELTHGVPRLINTTCDNCLLLASVLGAQQVTPEMVEQVAADSVPGLHDPVRVVTQPRPSYAGIR